MKTSLLLIAVVTLSGCGPQSLVTDGTYQSDSAGPIPNVSLVVDLKAKTTSVTMPGSSDPLVLQMTADPAQDWLRSCVDEDSCVRVETFEVAPNEAVLGALSMEGMRLTAGGIGAVPDANAVVIWGVGRHVDALDAAGAYYRLEFDRLVP